MAQVAVTALQAQSPTFKPQYNPSSPTPPKFLRSFSSFRGDIALEYQSLL
jgi:hypothetical protein